MGEHAEKKWHKDWAPVAPSRALVGRREGDTEDPQSWNRYAYVRNDPVNMVDPSGLSFFSWLMKAFFAVISAFSGVPIYLPMPGMGTPPIINNGPLGSTQIMLNGVYRPQDPSSFIITNFQNGVPQIGPPDPDFFKGYVYLFYGADIERCRKKIFRKTATKIAQQTFENSPALDTSQTGAQLKAQSSVKNNPNVSVGGLPFPDKGPNGTVAVAQEYWNSQISMETRAHDYVHELGNIISYKVSGSYTKYGNPNGVSYGNFKDYDTGANFELCVFGHNVFGHNVFGHK